MRLIEKSWVSCESSAIALGVSHLKNRKRGYFKTVLIYNCLLTKLRNHQMIFVVYAEPWPSLFTIIILTYDKSDDNVILTVTGSLKYS